MKPRISPIWIWCIAVVLTFTVPLYAVAEGETAQPTSTPEPSSSSPMVTETPSPTPDPTPTLTPAASPTPESTPTPTASPEPTAATTSEPEPSETPVPSDAASPTPDITPTMTPSPQPDVSLTPTPEASMEAAVESTATPEPVPSPKNAGRGKYDLEWLEGRRVVSGEVLVKLRNKAKIDDAIKGMGVTEHQTVSSTGVIRLKIPTNQSVESFVEHFSNNPNFEFIQPNYIYELQATVNDPFANNNYQWHHDVINSYSAWDTTAGIPSVIVAVLDTGVDTDHPDLAPNILLHTDVVDNDGSAEDDHGHGTHVSGLVAAVSNNSRGGAGVAPGAKLIVVDVFTKYTDGEYSSWGATSVDVIEGIEYAVNNGADIINMSLGSYWNDTAEQTAIDAATSADVLVICSAGNDNTTATHYPSDFEAAVSVISTNRLDQKSSFSNYGPGKDISAPGGEIAPGGDGVPYEGMVSTYLNGGYVIMSGTSMASPVVAGVCALILSANPGLSAEQVRNILYETSVDLGASGWDETFGHGRVDALAAVQRAQEIVTGVEFYSSTIDLQIDAENHWIANVYPVTALNQGITYSSNNSAVVEVVNNVVIGRSQGTATLTATSAEGGFTAQCTVNVVAFDSMVTFDSGTGTITGYSGNAPRLDIPLDIGGHAVTSLNADVFRGSDLREIGLPYTITNLADYALADCGALQWVYVSGTMAAMGDHSFDNHSGSLSFSGRQGSYAQSYAAGQGLGFIQDQDINRDGTVDMLDLSTVAQRYQTDNYFCDFNYDGVVNVFDLVHVGASLE